MTAQRPGITRRSSVVRDAFARAAEGHKTPVALDTWPVFAGGAALGKLDRALAAEGDLNPPWQLLDAIASANPGPLLEVLCERLGYLPPQRRPADPALLLDQVLAAGVEIQRAQAEIGEVLERVASLLPVRPAVRAVRT